MVTRLPRGTVKKIGGLQRWRCACCEVDIRFRFHMDHVISLAAGGEHAPLNIQLLCKTCNLKKSAKHPVDFMQQMGKLL
ncbi:HNH endonuclease [Variovorax sp. E3]|uniref:HNH endonuclease n=1 Tax=Variovorax sp. E3 TaxID=1914993 RepID=UPI0022B6D950|nr:HNH endonuclease signature motif containing protein [Variovorax sp. E3]